MFYLNWSKLLWRLMRPSYDVSNRLRTTKLLNCRAFVPVSVGTRSVKIHQERRKLLSNIKWYLSLDHGVLITVCSVADRMTAQLSADSELGDDLPGAGRTTGARSDSLSGAAKRTTRLHLPGMSQTHTRSLFVFSDDNFIRKYAQIIIEWGYPLCCVAFHNVCRIRLQGEPNCWLATSWLSNCCRFTRPRARRRVLHSWRMSAVPRQRDEWKRRLRACVRVKWHYFERIWHFWLWWH